MLRSTKVHYKSIDLFLFSILREHFGRDMGAGEYDMPAPQDKIRESLGIGREQYTEGSPVKPGMTVMSSRG